MITLRVPNETCKAILVSIYFLTIHLNMKLVDVISTTNT